MEPLVKFVNDGLRCVFGSPNIYYVGIEPQYSLMLSYLHLIDDYLKPDETYIPRCFQVDIFPTEFGRFL